jgi:hypothetical protein
MRNPFRYGQIVGPEAFCDRERERADLTRAMENGEHLFVFSERRMGKTSLVQRVLDDLPADRFLKLYVDLWPTDSAGSFARRLAQVFAERLEDRAERRLREFRRYISRLRPILSVDETGKPTLSVGEGDHRDPAPELEEVLAAPARAAADRGLRLAVVLDEFQRIFDYDGDLVERTLRTAVQAQPDAAYVFLGSRKHLIRSMLLDQSRPLYRAGGHYPLGPIAVEHWRPFIRERFVENGKPIGEAEIDRICDLTGGHPFYTQHLCHTAWELCESGRVVETEVVEQALGLLLDRERHAYGAQWEALTLNQRRLLTGLALDPPGQNVTSADFYARYGLSSASSVQRAIATLLTGDLIDRDNGSYLIADRFLRLWIRREHGGV